MNAPAQSPSWRYCPHCGGTLEPRWEGGLQRQACVESACGFVFYDNPVPVVAAVVEVDGHILLARNAAWTVPFYALITGFLEKGETPDIGVLREVEEETGLQPLAAEFIGHYEFHRKNQLLIAYHVPATGRVQLNAELSDYKLIPPEHIRYWPAGTGFALRDLLRRRGLDPQPMELPDLRAD